MKRKISRSVIPAKAGIQAARSAVMIRTLDSRFRGNDDKKGI